MANRWDERYNTKEFVFGTQPNDYLCQVVQHIKPGGKVLSLGEGEGRNAIHLAKLGFQVDCVDLSIEGVKKLNEWAKQEGLQDKVKAFVADLEAYEMKPGYDAIISIWCHMPSSVRVKVHAKVVKSLAIGGYFILEAYTPKNIGRGTGGPQDADRVLTADILPDELTGLKTVKMEELERDIHEGGGHNGMSSVIQYLGVKQA
ncbi:hypothetical protein HK103_001515 [Boothiomyces macroporosus]|uniref:Tellurite resistance methyltransferase TehB-like domain-containing protein n=1 Tax=Boothiomyces macroporosus TaxID=261099 RepID=A0AAD5UJR1_9FUNG|nr:hypothetical protein HK103_001515 [Boothiomyces macroporosus]